MYSKVHQQIYLLRYVLHETVYDNRYIFRHNQAMYLSYLLNNFLQFPGYP